MCDFTFINGGKCPEKSIENSNFCIMHINLPENTNSPEYQRLAELKSGEFKQRLDSQNYRFEGVILPELTIPEGYEIQETIDFRSSLFLGRLKFNKVLFKKDAIFMGATFQIGANFFGAIFKGEANFGETTFKYETIFHGATFHGTVNFHGANIQGATLKPRALLYEEAMKEAIWDEGYYTADFSKVIFLGAADFQYTTFPNKTDFIEAIFEWEALFYGATFQKYANFSRAEFWSVAGFIGTKFLGETNFQGAKFKGWTTNFNGATFQGWTNFKGCTFQGLAGFDIAIFDSDASFEGATFQDDTSFIRAKFKSSAFLKNITNLSNISFHGSEIDVDLDFSNSTISGNIYLDNSKILGRFIFKNASIKEFPVQEQFFRRAKRLREEVGDKVNADNYFFQEMVVKRKQKPVIPQLFELPFHYIFWYGVYPLRVIGIWIVIVIGFGLFYFLQKAIMDATSIGDYVYFSLIIAATPGFGSYVMKSGYEWFAICEAFLGTMLWAAFIATAARKFSR